MSEGFQSLPPETRQAVESAMRSLLPARTADEVREMLIRNEKGQVPQRFENYVTAMTSDPLLHDAIRLNTMTERVGIVKPVGWKRKTPALTDTDLRYLRLYLEQNYDLGNPKNIAEVVELIANERQCHPVCELLESLQWDGVERIRSALHRFLGAPEDDFSYEVLKLFMMGCIERVYHPGCKFDYMLCLVGGQGAGKSSFFRLLSIRDEWFSDGSFITPDKGTPQGGIISPLLANIVLNELDHWIESQWQWSPICKRNVKPDNGYRQAKKSNLKEMFIARYADYTEVETMPKNSLMSACSKLSA